MLVEEVVELVLPPFPPPLLLDWLSSTAVPSTSWSMGLSAAPAWVAGRRRDIAAVSDRAAKARSRTMRSPFGPAWMATASSQTPSRTRAIEREGLYPRPVGAKLQTRMDEGIFIVPR